MGKFRKVLGVILILIGIGIIGNVVYKKIVTSQKQKQLIGILEGESTNKENQGNTNNESELKLSDINGYKAIAILEIPSIKLKQGVVEGVSDDVLKYYLGHYDGTANPGEKGNFVVAGHRVSDYTDAFINLYKVKKNDEIIVKTEDKKYTYIVDDNFIVEPEQVEVLEQTENESITLITCTVGAQQRVIVKGTLKKVENL